MGTGRHYVTDIWDNKGEVHEVRKCFMNLRSVWGRGVEVGQRGSGNSSSVDPTGYRRCFGRT
jgi:hypothetical protein